jgi:hypothetical protein
MPESVTGERLILVAVAILDEVTREKFPVLEVYELYFVASRGRGRTGGNVEVEETAV